MILRRTSIRFRLTVWYAAVLLSIQACVSIGIYAFVRSSLERSLSAQLDRDFDTVITVVSASPEGWGAGGHLPGDVLFRVMEHGRVLYHSDAWCRARFFKDVDAQPITNAGAWRSIQGLQHRLMARPIVVDGRELNVTVAEDTTLMEGTIRSLLRMLLLSIPLAAALAIGGGYLLAGRALLPISAMASKSREITADALSERLPVDNPDDELGRMATVFNETLGRLQASFETLRNFTGNVSHELRTPLTAIRSVGEVAMQRNLDADALRDVIGSMLEEVDRLTRLIECMLALARTEAGHAQSMEREVDLAAEANAALELVRVLAEEKSQAISMSVRGPAVVRGDPSMLRQALLNLIDNAIRYTPEGGSIRVSVGTGPGGSMVEVEDDGPGIPSEDRERMFDRFYRAKSRSAAVAHGAGLGLAIAKAAVEAAGGRLEYDAADGAGSRFRITFPAIRTRREV